MNISLRQKIIAIVVALGVALIVLFQVGLGSQFMTKEEPQAQNTNEIKIVSTNPSPLNEATVAPNQTIEITFNKPLANDPAKVKIDPQVELDVQLSSDHHTMKITPKNGFDLGASYVLTIQTGYNLENNLKLEHDEVFRFQTINYSGV